MIRRASRGARGWMSIAALFAAACDDASLATVESGADARARGDAATMDSGDDGDAGETDATTRDAITPRDVGPLLPDAMPPPTDSGSPVLDAPALVAPWNGYYTGSALVPDSVMTVHPLRPTFRWDTVGRADAYEIVIGDECTGTWPDCVVEGTTERTSETTFTPSASLDVDRIPPVGRRYYWAVRACDDDTSECSPWSTPRYLEVGRQRTDFDGDGHADAAIVAAAAYSEGNVGAVLVYRGTSDGLADPPALRIDPPFDQRGAGYGAACAAIGDVDGDGYPELAISATRREGRGVVLVHHGSASGLSAVPEETLAPPTGDADGATFGNAVAGGDLDGDGFADIAIGAPNRAGGAVFVHRGGLDGIEPMTTLRLTERRSTVFGSAVAIVGDTNGDGFVDLLAGDVFHSSDASHAGRAWLHRGSRELLVEDAPTAVFDSADDEVDGQMSSSLEAVGDLDGDGFADIAIGANFHDADSEGEGVVYLFRGARDAIDTTAYVTLSDPADEVGVEHGRIIGGGDLDADGLSDLALGTFFSTAGGARYAGRVDVHAGRAGGIEEAPTRTLLGPAIEDNRFGSSASVIGDVEGDGERDLLVGAVGPVLGTASLYASTRGGIDALPQVIECPDPLLTWFGVGAASGAF